MAPADIPDGESWMGVNHSDTYPTRACRTFATTDSSVATPWKLAGAMDYIASSSAVGLDRAKKRMIRNAPLFRKAISDSVYMEQYLV